MDNYFDDKKKKYVLFGLVILLFFGNFYFFFKANSLSKKVFENQTEISGHNEKVVSFFSLFIEKVLKSEQEIDFDTRLSLENSVRATGDKDLISQWQKFTNSQTEEEAQIEVKNLLGLIAEKLK